MSKPTTNSTGPHAASHPIPEGIPSASPHIVVRDAVRALDFYKRAFGAVETLRLQEPSGRLGHAEFTVARAHIMMADEYPEMGIVGPQTLGGTTFSIHIYVEDVDAIAARAVAAGATLERPVSDEFYGDRVASLKDPFGHRWSFASRVEEVSPEEMQRRFEKMVSG